MNLPAFRFDRNRKWIKKPPCAAIRFAINLRMKTLRGKLGIARRWSIQTAGEDFPFEMKVKLINLLILGAVVEWNFLALTFSEGNCRHIVFCCLLSTLQFSSPAPNEETETMNRLTANREKLSESLVSLVFHTHCQSTRHVF